MVVHNVHGPSHQTKSPQLTWGGVSLWSYVTRAARNPSVYYRIWHDDKRYEVLSTRPSLIVSVDVHVTHRRGFPSCEALDRRNSDRLFRIVRFRVTSTTILNARFRRKVVCTSREKKKKKKRIPVDSDLVDQTAPPKHRDVRVASKKCLALKKWKTTVLRAFIRQSIVEESSKPLPFVITCLLLEKYKIASPIGYRCYGRILDNLRQPPGERENDHRWFEDTRNCYSLEVRVSAAKNTNNQYSRRRCYDREDIYPWMLKCSIGFETGSWC